MHGTKTQTQIDRGFLSDDIVEKHLVKLKSPVLLTLHLKKILTLHHCSWKKVNETNIDGVQYGFGLSFDIWKEWGPIIEMKLSFQKLKNVLIFVYLTLWNEFLYQWQ